MEVPLKEAYQKYANYVAKNIQTVGQIESGVRILSYIIPGQTVVLSELLYSGSNLLILLNDCILRQANNVRHKIPLPSSKLCTWLTIIEHVEVFLEISARSAGGESWRWFVIVCIQIVKTALRYILMRYYGGGVLHTPPILPLKRSEDLTQQSEQDDDNDDDDEEEQSVPIGRSDRAVHATFTLSRSGRQMRSLAATPQAKARSWNIGGALLTEHKRLVKTVLNDKQMLGEYLHISRPLLHLLSMYVLGSNSWKPWLVAGGVDLTSTYLLGDIKEYNAEEAREIRRRNTVLLCYLLRSPFYDTYTKTRLMFLLQYMSDNIPLVRLVCKPLLDYLPYWQRIYFYSWMT